MSTDEQPQEIATDAARIKDLIHRNRELEERNRGLERRAERLESELESFEWGRKDRKPSKIKALRVVNGVDISGVFE